MTPRLVQVWQTAEPWRASRERYKAKVVQRRTLAGESARDKALARRSGSMVELAMQTGLGSVSWKAVAVVPGLHPSSARPFSGSSPANCAFGTGETAISVALKRPARTYETHVPTCCGNARLQSSCGQCSGQVGRDWPSATLRRSKRGVRPPAGTDAAACMGDATEPRLGYAAG